jgi:hypothetical protein
VSSLEIYAQLATKSGKSTRKSRILSLSKNTCGYPVSYPDPVTTKFLSERKLNSYLQKN